MENASKALLIAGAILLAILIIAIGMFIYTSAQSTIQNSMSSMTTQEIEGFNSNFTTYEGKQTGSQVKALLGRLIANANTYEDEPGKVPNVTIQTKKTKSKNSVNYEENNAGDCTNYSKGLSTARSQVEAKHEYTVTMPTGQSGLIEEVVIEY